MKLPASFPGAEAAPGSVVLTAWELSISGNIRRSPFARRDLSSESPFRKFISRIGNVFLAVFREAGLQEALRTFG